MKKILDNPTYQNRDGYNGLDLSSTVTFTSTVAHLLPVSWDFLQPGDKVKLRCNLLSRTSPLLSSAFARIEQNVHYFFVPISQIYKPFEQTYNGIQDFGSDFYHQFISQRVISDFIPHVQLGSIMRFLLDRVSNHDSNGLFNAIRLLECLGLPTQIMCKYDYNNSATGSESWKGHSVNLLPLLAYHKIWYDYFRDTDRIVNDPTYYNADMLVDGSTPSDARLAKLLTLHNVPKFKDLANNLYVSPLFGQNGIGGDGNASLTKVNQWLSAIDEVNPENTDGFQDFEKPTVVNSGNYDVASLRAAFAANKLLEITRRAKKHYDAQILAHFGIDVPTGVDGECFEIGKHVQVLDIGAVISQAATAEAALGEIGGKGYSSDASPLFSFEAKTHGIIMACYYARPAISYYQFGLDKKLLYTRVSDFPRLEYDNLGQQPVFAMNQYLLKDASDNAVVEGWQYRYSEVKDKIDRNILGTARTLKNWTVSANGVYSSRDGRFEDFYVSPFQINQIMEIPYSEDWRFWDGSPTETPSDPADVLDENIENMFDTDPFINQLRLSYQKATKLSVYGLQEI